MPGNFNKIRSFRTKLVMMFFFMGIMISGAMGVFHYYKDSSNVKTNFNKYKNVISYETLQKVKSTDSTYYVLENILNKNMIDILENVKKEYEAKNELNFNLDKFVDGNTLYSIYIIDRNNVIVKSTDKTEEGLDFNKFASVAKTINSIRAKGKVYSSRVMTSLKYTDARIYCYLPSKDKKYIFEASVPAETFLDNLKVSNYKSLTKDSLRPNYAIESLYIYRHNGIAYSKGPDGNNKSVNKNNADSFLEAVNSNKTVEKTVYENNKKLIYEYIPYDPIHTKSMKDRNVIEICYNYKIFKNQSKDNGLQLGGIFLAITLFNIFISFRFSRIVSDPIKELIDATKRISKGDFSKKVYIKSEDEFRTLSSSFNGMIDELNEREASLKKANIELIQKNEKINAYYEETAALNEQLEDLVEENTRSYIETISALSEAIEIKDSYTRGHSERVKNLSIKIGRQMGINKSELDDLIRGSLLHDIGKIGIPEAILQKKEKLTDVEYEIIKKHPLNGYEILKNVHFLGDGLKVVTEHHERYDGKGYPYGLKGREINILARIACVADAYDAMTSARIYREKPLTDEEAMKELIRNRGTQFDPDVVDSFIRCDRV